MTAFTIYAGRETRDPNPTPIWRVLIADCNMPDGMLRGMFAEMYGGLEDRYEIQPVATARTRAGARLIAQAVEADPGEFLS